MVTREALPLLPAVAEALLAKNVVLVADAAARKVIGEDKCELANDSDFRCCLPCSCSCCSACPVTLGPSLTSG